MLNHNWHWEFPSNNTLNAKAFAALLAVTAVSSVASGQEGDEEDSTVFHEISTTVGLDFTHSSGIDGNYRFPEIMGSGAAVFDYDNDGLLDIYLVDSGDLQKGSNIRGNRLFRQLPTGRFEDSTKDSGLGDRGYGMGVALGDVDNDGDLDVYVTNLKQDRIYRNMGDGSFQDITAKSGIHVVDWSTSATFCDVNADGLLDLYVGTYVVDDKTRVCRTSAGEIDYCAPNVFNALPDRLFVNQGEFEFKERIMDRSEFPKKNRALGVMCADFNGDSYSDIFVANDGERNFMWINDGNGYFDEKGIPLGVAVNMFGETEASMGVDIADLNNDGRMDIFVTHLDRETDTIYLSDRDFFLDSTADLGLSIPTFSDSAFGTAFADFNHDGHLDLVIANGNVRKTTPKNVAPLANSTATITEFHRDFAGTNRLFLGGENGRFRVVDKSTFDIEDPSRVSRGLITADIDEDGDLDILVSNSNSSVQLYRNTSANPDYWVKFRVLDPATKRDALGSVVVVDLGRRTISRPVVHTRGYLTSQDAAVHFGLGNVAIVEKVTVHWHDGMKEVFGPLEANKVHALLKTNGTQAN